MFLITRIASLLVLVLLLMMSGCSSYFGSSSSHDTDEETDDNGDGDSGGGGDEDEDEDGDDDDPDEQYTGTGFPLVNDFAEPGPFATVSDIEGPDCEIFKPHTLGENDLEHPVLVWGNGTFTGPGSYAAFLSHWASHGFVVAAARTSNAGSGDEMLACLDYLEEQHLMVAGIYAGNLDLDRIAATGYSQGGGGAIMAAQDSRIIATVPIMPFITGFGHDNDSQSNQHGPMFMTSGENDTWAPPGTNQQPVFDNANVPVFWGTLLNTDHFEPLGDGGDFRGPSTAWLRFHLMDDDTAQDYFYGDDCELCTDPDWTVQRKDIE